MASEPTEAPGSVMPAAGKDRLARTLARVVLIHGVMRAGGLLYVGHSENFTDARQLFRLRGKTIYERL